MKKIPLTRGEFAIVDDEDFDWISKRKWRCEDNGGNRKYAKSGGAYDSVYMHCLITKKPPGMQTDHINGNGLDNRKDNLRVVTEKQNHYNQSIKSNNTSGYKGVWLYKTKSGTTRFVAEIRKDRVRYHIGVFSTAKEAAIAYNNKSLEIFGEFGRLNVV